jgi:hypothetical protein
VYFPVGLSLVDDAKYLAVVNSDFDLQYNAGTLAVLDVNRLQAFVPRPCEADSDCDSGRCDRALDESDTGEHSYLCIEEGETDPCRGLGERPAAARLLNPGLCNFLDPVRPPDDGKAVQISSVEIGAFATDAVFRARPSHQGDEPLGRLFVPVRGDATVHWLDVLPGGKLDCGQERNHGACDDAHRAGDDPDNENTRDLRLAPEPFGIATDELGTAVLVTNQTSGKVSVFRNDWTSTPMGLQLEFEVANLPSRPMGVVALPTPGVSRALALTADEAAELQMRRPGATPREYYSPGFLVTFRNASEVDLIRYFGDEQSSTERPYAARANAASITINSIGSDSRGIAIDDSKRLAREQACAADAMAAGGNTEIASQCKLNEADCSEGERAYLKCLHDEASQALDVFVASRAPSSLLVGRTTPVENALQSTELPAFYDTVSLSQGPSRVVVGNVIVGEVEGQLEYEPRVFVSCFDSRRVFVYDPVRRRIEVEIATGRGPHALAVDEKNGHLLVGHFTDSFIGVVSLDRRYSHTYGKMLATVGEPSAPRASK